VKEEEMRELKRRGFNSTTMEQKPKRKLTTDLESTINAGGLLICIIILLFIIMLFFIPQAIYYAILLGWFS
jgi:hypothetical protein